MKSKIARRWKEVGFVTVFIGNTVNSSLGRLVTGQNRPKWDMSQLVTSQLVTPVSVKKSRQQNTSSRPYT